MRKTIIFILIIIVQSAFSSSKSLDKNVADTLKTAFLFHKEIPLKHLRFLPYVITSCFLIKSGYEVYGNHYLTTDKFRKYKWGKKTQIIKIREIIDRKKVSNIIEEALDDIKSNYYFKDLAENIEDNFYKLEIDEYDEQSLNNKEVNYSYSNTGSGPASVIVMSKNKETRDMDLDFGFALDKDCFPYKMDYMPKKEVYLHDNVFNNINPLKSLKEVYQDCFDNVKDLYSFLETIEELEDNVMVAIIDNSVDQNHPELAKFIPRVEYKDLTYDQKNILKSILVENMELIADLRSVDDNGKKSWIISKLRANKLLYRKWEAHFNVDYIEFKYTNDYFPNAGLRQNHGTHVAGIVASGNSARILPITTSYKFSDVLNKIDVALQNNARIINLSLITLPNDRDFGLSKDGSYRKNIPKIEKYQLANQKFSAIFDSNADVLFISAGGNQSNNLSITPKYPAATISENHIVVASVNKEGRLAHSSNFSKKLVDFAARGVDVRSALPGNLYGEMSGTSMAAPLVTKIVSKILKISPQLSPTMVKNILCETVDKTPELIEKTRCGGIVNESRAIEKALSMM